MVKTLYSILHRSLDLTNMNPDIIQKWYSEVLKIEIEDWNGTVIKPQLGNETIFLSLPKMIIIFQ